MSAADHRATLGLGPGANDDDIRRAYRRLARRHHPDRGGNTSTMAHINRAYEALLVEETVEPPMQVATEWVMVESDQFWPEPVGWHGLIRYLMAIMALPVVTMLVVSLWFLVRYFSG